jgi:hypothetical protein
MVNIAAVNSVAATVTARTELEIFLDDFIEGYVTV